MLTGQTARIIITTLQKFPVIVDKVADLGDRRYAVTVDEAHSSQTGDAAKDLRLVLGASPADALTAAEADEGSAAEPVNDVEDMLARQVEARQMPKNLSFFAVTATPTAKTLELFGVQRPVSEGGS
jgi:type I restriction enzyme, R subunit